MSDADTVLAVSTAVVDELIARKLEVATAESCTGGWIAKALTDVAGSSACFGYGVVSYSNDAKISLLGVSAATLEEQGAVSKRTVREMAEGALRLSGADVAVAVSGIAGPEGGTADKPVGTVWLAWSMMKNGRPQTATERQRYDGNRESVRVQTVVRALRGILDRIRQS